MSSELFFLVLILVAVNFVSCSDIKATSIEVMKVQCNEHNGVKAYRESSIFGIESRSVICNDDIVVSIPRKDSN